MNNFTKTSTAVADTQSQYDTSRTNFSILIAICFAHMSNDLIQAIIPSTLPLLQNNFALNFAQIGLITFCFQVSSSIFQPLVGMYTDKHPTPFSQIIGMMLSASGVVLLSHANHYYWVLIAVTLIGLGSSIFHPESSRIAFLSSGGRRSLAQSIFQIGGNTGAALGPLLVAWIVLPHGQKNILWFVVVAAFAELLLWKIDKWYSGMLKFVRKHKKSVIKLPDLSHKRVVVTIGILLLLIFSKYIYMASITSYLQFYMMDQFHIDKVQAQIYLFYFLIAIALGTLIGGFFGDILGRKYIIWISVLGCAPFTLLLPYANQMWTGVLVAIIGFILASAFPSILVYAQELLPKKLGMVSGLFYGFAFGMGGLGAALLGWWADHSSIEFIYHVCSFLPLIGIVAYFLPDMKRIHFKEEKVA